MTVEEPAFDEVRWLAWNILGEIEKSQVFADLLLEKAFSQNPFLRPLDRAFIWEMVLGTLRWRGRIDAIIQAAVKFPEKKIDPRLLQLLRLGAYQILFLDRVPDSAAVDKSVRLAKAIFRNEQMAGFTNAILRSIARNKNRENFPSFMANPAEYLVQALSHPRWLVERWIKEFGLEKTRDLCTANNRKPPFTIRVNTLKASREWLREQLAASGVQSFPTAYSPDGLILGKGPFLESETLFQDGFYFVQDEASQIVPYLMDVHPGEIVLDACAAPGGKSTHMAQLMQNRGEIFSLDLHKSKLDLVRENCQRMGISIVKTLQMDASRPLSFPDGLTFDKILLDAPCTGLGILHRNPEAKWRRKPEDISRLAGLQTKLLENVSSRLKPGGILVYSICTMTREENDKVVKVFLRAHQGFFSEDLRTVVGKVFHPLIDGAGFLRTYPKWTTNTNGYRLDGFFAARIKKVMGNR